ncbi:hypothetical protein ACFLWF_00800 [Chloroflexota bacterium]
MLWLRRIIAIPLALGFIILFIFLLIVFRVNATVGNPDFYIDQLQQADIYNFIYHDVLPTALEETLIGVDTSEAPIGVSQLAPHILGMIEQTLPPEWLQVQTEQIINQVLPYALGDTQGFNIDIPLKDRVEAANQAVKDTLHKKDVFPILYDQAIDLATAESASSLEELPPLLSMSGDDMESILRTVLPGEWILMQMDTAIDEAVPYFTKDKEDFRVQLDISERMDALEIVVADILKEPETYDYLFDNLVASSIQQNTQEVTQLPLGITITDDEILGAAREVLTLDWYQARVTDMVRQIFSYLKGTQETIDIVIPLADSKPAMAKVLGDLVDQKLEIVVDSLPEYLPGDISFSEVKELLGIDTSALLSPFMDMWIPDQLVFDDAELSQLLAGEGDENILTQARERVQNGLTYTDEDLRAQLGADYKNVEDTRQWIASGFIFTEKELRHLVVDAGGEAADEQWQSFDEVRSQIGTVRRWVWGVWLIPVLLLAGIGALGGRRWNSKLVWAASVLAMASAIAYAVFGPLFSALAKPRINDAIMSGIGQTEGLQVLVAEKSIATVQNAIDSFVGGINIQAISLLVVSLVVIILVSVWHPWSRSSEQTQGQATSE